MSIDRLYARALALVAQCNALRAAGTDKGELFRWMCEEIYGRPVEQLTEPERITVLKALDMAAKPAEPEVYDLDAAEPPTAEDLAMFSDPLSTAPKASSLTAHAASAKDLAVFLGLLLPGAVNPPPASPTMPIEDQQVVDREQWEAEHPGEKFPRPKLPGHLKPSKHPSPFPSYRNLVWTDEPAPETKSSQNPWLAKEADFSDTTTYQAKDEDGAGYSCNHKMDGGKGWCGRCEKSDSRIQTEGSGGDEAGLAAEVTKICEDTEFADKLPSVIANCGVYDAIIGLYWYCTNYHGGQASDAYRVLSQLSQIYTPGPNTRGPEHDSTELLAYEEFGGNPMDYTAPDDSIDDEPPAGPQDMGSDDPHEK